jgi:hypothetical protein
MDFTRMAKTSRRGPRGLSEILSELFTARGYGRLTALGELEDAWNGAVGEPHCRQTRLGDIRRGVVTVTVAHPTLLEELAAFRKPELLAALRGCAPGAKIQDIRFRVGPIGDGPGGGPRPPAAPGRAGGATDAGVDPGTSGRRHPGAKPRGSDRGRGGSTS